jgi:hypothetical protein
LGKLVEELRSGWPVEWAADVRETAVSPKDVLATALHLLGIDPHPTVPDRTGRPMPIVGEGQVRPELPGV